MAPLQGTITCPTCKKRKMDKPTQKCPPGRGYVIVPRRVCFFIWGKPDHICLARQPNLDRWITMRLLRKERCCSCSKCQENPTCRHVLCTYISILYTYYIYIFISMFTLFVLLVKGFVTFFFRESPKKEIGKGDGLTCFGSKKAWELTQGCLIRIGKALPQIHLFMAGQPTPPLTYLNPYFWGGGTLGGGGWLTSHDLSQVPKHIIPCWKWSWKVKDEHTILQKANDSQTYRCVRFHVKDDFGNGHLESKDYLWLNLLEINSEAVMKVLVAAELFCPWGVWLL